MEVRHMRLARRCLFGLLLGMGILSTPYVYGYRFVVYGDSRGTGGPDAFNNAILGAMNEKIARLDPKPERPFSSATAFVPDGLQTTSTTTLSTGSSS